MHDDDCRAGNVSRSECFRLNKAATLLEDTDRSVAEVASECGFDNQSYFSLQFRITQRGSSGSVMPRGKRHSAQIWLLLSDYPFCLLSGT